MGDENGSDREVVQEKGCLGERGYLKESNRHVDTRVPQYLYIQGARRTRIPFFTCNVGHQRSFPYHATVKQACEKLFTHEVSTLKIQLIHPLKPAF